MPFPPASTVVPALTPLQCSFNGLTMGPNTAYGLTKIEGLDRPAVRSGNTARPRTRGESIGLDLLSGRDITLTMDIMTDGTSFAHAIGALRNATAPAGTTEVPFFINLAGITYAVMCRAVKRAIPIDINYVLGGLAKDAAVMWHATDGYIYLAPTGQSSAGIATPAGGMRFNITFNLSFGGAVSANSVTCMNSGDTESYPILTVTGPCITPSMTLGSMPGNPTLTFGLSMNAGDQLVIDTDLGSVVYYSAGSLIGSTRLNTLMPGASWFSLPPNQASIIQFSSADTTPGAASLNVQYASSYSSAT